MIDKFFDSLGSERSSLHEFISAAEVLPKRAKLLIFAVFTVRVLLSRKRIFPSHIVVESGFFYSIDGIAVFLEDWGKQSICDLPFISQIKMQVMKSGFNLLKIFPILLLDTKRIECELFSIFFFLLGRELFIGFVVVDNEGIALFIQSVDDSAELLLSSVFFGL